MICIKNIEVFHSENKIPITELIENENLIELQKDYFEGCGVKGIYESKELSSLDLAVEAAHKTQQNFSEKIDYVIYIKSRIPEYFISSEAARLQQSLNLDNDTKIITLSDYGCADSSIAISLATDLLANEKINNILILYGSKKYLNSRFRYPVTVMTDMGVSCIVGKSDSEKYPAIIDIEIQTNGKYHDLFKIDYKGKPIEEYEEKCKSLREYNFELALESRNAFTNINNKILERNGLTYDDVPYFIMQNISLNAFYFYEEFFNIKFAQECYKNLESGHAGAADIILNLKTLQEQKTENKDNWVIMMNNSPVACWATILIKL